MKKNILITGHSRGIGKNIVSGLKDIYHIYGISRTKDTHNFCKKSWQIDLSVEKNFDDIKNFFTEKNKKIDTLILNAGIGYFGDFFETSSQKYQNIIQTNLSANIFLILACEHILAKNAKIIFIGSIIGKKSLKGASVYQASKFGLRGFALGLKNEMQKKKIYIINPRIVDTDFHNEKSQFIQLPHNQKTNIDDIVQVVKECILGNEKRFEIDL